jgi:D-glycero-D-manno-heptose 1,7-bisphosphate phosphatase
MANFKGYVLLDRDGTINQDRPDYVYLPSHFKILPGVVDAIHQLNDAGYGIIVVTNQAGIAKGLYAREDMIRLHHRFQEKCDGLILHFYYSPWHPSVTESLTRKPGTLMFEKAVAKFDIDPSTSWMIGDRDRDLIPAKKLGFNTIQVKEDDSPTADAYAKDLPAAVDIILGK